MSENQDLDIIRAAGGIVRREAGGMVCIALVHRQKYDDWSLPKGKLKVQETWISGAIREVEEEIQCSVSAGEFAGCCCYPVAGIPKIVLFWWMKVEAENAFVPNEEIDRILWVSPDQAILLLSYECERKLVNDIPELF